MESRYKSSSLFQFQERFPNSDKCYEYLSELKWSNGYKCSKCNQDLFCQGHNQYDRKCTRCRHIESPTSGTLFHKLKFPILKAIYIVYYVSTSKSGINSTELSRKLELRQKTCWLFKQKVMKAMESSKTNLMTGKVDVDETYVGGQDDSSIGRNEGKKKIVVMAVERKGKRISRVYGKVIKTASRKNLQSFMKEQFVQRQR